MISDIVAEVAHHNEAELESGSLLLLGPPGVGNHFTWASLTLASRSPYVCLTFPLCLPYVPLMFALCSLYATFLVQVLSQHMGSRQRVHLLPGCAVLCLFGLYLHFCFQLGTHSTAVQPFP